MLKRKLLPLLLLVVGTIWALFHGWFHIVMSAVTESVYPLPVHFLLMFIGPVLLIVGSTLALVNWHSRIGPICCIIACAWLSWEFGGMILETYLQPLLHPNSAIGSPYNLETSIYVASEGAFFVVADVAAIMLLRSSRKPSGQATLQ
jgi:hypothetical protein